MKRQFLAIVGIYLFIFQAEALVVDKSLFEIRERNANGRLSREGRLFMPVITSSEQLPNGQLLKAPLNDKLCLLKAFIGTTLLEFKRVCIDQLRLPDQWMVAIQIPIIHINDDGKFNRNIHEHEKIDLNIDKATFFDFEKKTSRSVVSVTDVFAKNDGPRMLRAIIEFAPANEKSLPEPPVLYFLGEVEVSTD